VTKQLLNSMTREWNSVALETLGVLRVSGADRVKFLQGQLSNDVTTLSAERAQLAGFHNPQGRVIALLLLIEKTTDEMLAVLPRELIGPVVGRLAKYVLRAKVQLMDESAHWRLTGLIAPAASTATSSALAVALPEVQYGSARIGDSLAVCVAEAAPARWLLLSPHDAQLPAVLASAAAAPLKHWQRLSVAAGEPQVYASTSEEFVAQMLNLDVLGAIAFDKGCYTGQEVIARAHYRGRVKRRLQRFFTHEEVLLKPGDSGELPDGRAFKVVEAAALEGGGSEFLAVAALAAGEAAAADARGEQRVANRIAAQALALPYALPD